MQNKMHTDEHRYEEATKETVSWWYSYPSLYQGCVSGCDEGCVTSTIKQFKIVAISIKMDNNYKLDCPHLSVRRTLSNSS